MDDTAPGLRLAIQRALWGFARALPLRRPGHGRRMFGGRLGRNLRGGIRIRLVWWFIVVLALASAASIVLVRQVLVQRLDVRIETELRQEVDEIRQLADGNDPETGLPFGNRADRIFEVFFERNIPAQHETMITFLDGRLHLHSPTRVAYPLHEDPALTARWAGLVEQQRDRVATPAGTVEYLAVPFLVEGRSAGVFVVASFRDLQRADTDAASLAAAMMGIVMLLVGSVLTIRLADRLLAPVSAVTKTARSISETDLSQRIPVDGNDEISELAATFNDMLGRLDEAFAAQRRFIDDAGHELKTPITVIGGHLELMDDDPDDRRRTLELVSDELDRMTRMVDDLVTLARSERLDFLRPRLVDVDELTVRIVQNAQGLGPREWRLDAVATTRAVLDDQRIKQAILELASNAIRHTADGETIGIGSSADAGQIRMWVRNGGPGVPADESDRIFERFYRGRSGYRRSDGAGLGLSIVKAIAEAHGGTVEVTGEPDETVFAIVLPAIVDPGVVDRAIVDGSVS